MRELALIGEVAGLRRSPYWPTGGAPPGEGQGAVVVPGFGVPAATVTPLARWLRSGGWAVEVPALGWNVGCGTEAAAAVEALVRTQADRTGRPVVVLGHSRGGLLGRVAAVRVGDAVGHLVTICTPWSIEPPDRPGVEAVGRGLRYLRRHGLHRFGSIDCATGPCCRAFREEMHRTPSARWTALWSSEDEIAGPSGHPDAAADDIIDLRTSHLGAVLSVAGWATIARVLDH